MLAAGLKPRPRFNATAALSSSALMYLAVVALVMPDLFHATRGLGHPPDASALAPGLGHPGGALRLEPSVLGATAHQLFEGADAVEAELESEGTLTPRPWSLGLGMTVLLVTTAATVVVSELLVGSLEMVIERWGLTPTFVGVIVIAVVGNAAERQHRRAPGPGEAARGGGEHLLREQQAESRSWWRRCWCSCPGRWGTPSRWSSATWR